MSARADPSAGTSPGKLRELALFRQQQKHDSKSPTTPPPTPESQKTAGVGFVSAGKSR
jgi:hypothetical protein